MLMRKILLVGFSIALIVGCTLNPKNFTLGKAAPHAASRPKINGYGPVKFGMKRDEATGAIGATAQEMKLDEKEKPTLFFKDYQDQNEFDAWVYFDKKTDTVNKVELTSVNALNAARNGADCLYIFRQYLATFTNAYGDVDQPVIYKSEDLESKATAFFTFGDSSSVRLAYKFNDAKRQCKINILYVGPWAT